MPVQRCKCSICPAKELNFLLTETGSKTEVLKLENKQAALKFFSS